MLEMGKLLLEDGQLVLRERSELGIAESLPILTDLLASLLPLEKRLDERHELPVLAIQLSEPRRVGQHRRLAKQLVYLCAPPDQTSELLLRNHGDRAVPESRRQGNPQYNGEFLWGAPGWRRRPAG